jgi:hypothetical protein
MIFSFFIILINVIGKVCMLFIYSFRHILEHVKSLFERELIVSELFMAKFTAKIYEKDLNSFSDEK